MLLYALFLGGCSALSPDPAVGTWTGTSTLGQELTLELKPSGELRVVYPNGSRLGTWTIDRSHDPIHFTLDLDDREPLETIAKFPDANTLVYVDVGSGDERPTGFDGVTMTFARQP